MDEQFIRRHAGLVEAISSEFVNQIDVSSAHVENKLLEYLGSGLELSGPSVEHSPENMSVLSGLVPRYLEALKESGYYQAIIEFSKTLSIQVSAFGEVYKSMGGLPPLDVSKHLELLVEHAGLAVVAMEGESARVAENLRSLAGGSTLGSPATLVFSRVSEIVRKISRVEQMAHDQLMTFFRFFGHLVYREAEVVLGPLVYEYVGLGADRAFCRSLKGKLFSLEEIAALDNGQTAGAHVWGGGYGCNHWWAVAPRS